MDFPIVIWRDDAYAAKVVVIRGDLAWVRFRTDYGDLDMIIGLALLAQHQIPQPMNGFEKPKSRSLLKKPK